MDIDIHTTFIVEIIYWLKYNNDKKKEVHVIHFLKIISCIMETILSSLGKNLDDIYKRFTGIGIAKDPDDNDLEKFYIIKLYNGDDCFNLINNIIKLYKENSIQNNNEYTDEEKDYLFDFINLINDIVDSIKEADGYGMCIGLSYELFQDSYKSSIYYSNDLPVCNFKGDFKDEYEESY